MSVSPSEEGMLSPYRVLDLTDERGLLCGKILADLGADVIQVEPSTGNSARRIGPFYQDDVHLERSLFWWSYTANKRSITLNLATADGQMLLKRLVRSADFLIESSRPGDMAALGLGCQEAVARALASAPQSYAMTGAVIVRQGSYRQTGATTYMRITWPCQDGFVNFQLSGGAAAGRGVNNLVRWMAEEGLGDAYLESLDFTQLGYGNITREVLARIVPPVERFLLSHTKQELFEGAV